MVRKYHCCTPLNVFAMLFTLIRPSCRFLDLLSHGRLACIQVSLQKDRLMPSHTFSWVNLWQPEQSSPLMEVSNTGREEGGGRGDQSLSSSSMAVKAVEDERCYLVRGTNHGLNRALCFAPSHPSLTGMRHLGSSILNICIQ